MMILIAILHTSIIASVVFPVYLGEVRNALRHGGAERDEGRSQH